jgi:hypothetical protein
LSGGAEKPLSLTLLINKKTPNHTLIQNKKARAALHGTRFPKNVVLFISTKRPWVMHESGGLEIFFGIYAILKQKSNITLHGNLLKEKEFCLKDVTASRICHNSMDKKWVKSA